MNPKTNIYVLVGIIVIGAVIYFQSSAFSDVNTSETNENGISLWGIFFGGIISSIIMQIGKLTKKP
jgi:uncharacterized membrane protein